MKEKLRRRNKGLCYYCGSEEHKIDACVESSRSRRHESKTHPIPPNNGAAVSTEFIPHHKPLILQTKITFNNRVFLLPALVDTGADGNLDVKTAQKLGLLINK